MNQTIRRWLSALALTGLLLATGMTSAATTARVSSNTLALGQSTTLTLSTDETINGQPDLRALEADFSILNQSSGSSTTIINGQVSATHTITLEIEPKRSGVLVIPPLTLGGSASEPVVLTVGAAAPAGPGTELYIETVLGSEQPYVQQVVPYTVKLYYTLGRLQGDVEVPPPANASLKQVGQDQNYSQEVAGQRYNVFQRNYLLVPERSGPLELPGARFRGRAPTPGADPFFDRGRSVSTRAPARTLTVRPQPDGAALPWLPASALQLVRADLSGVQAVAGEPLVVELSLSGEGLTQAQLPELNLPPIPGAQVFPEPAQSVEDLLAQPPRASVKRRFAIVPDQPGALTLPAVRISWWNTQTDQAAVAELPALTLDVIAGSRTLPATTPDIAPSAAAAADTAAGAADRPREPSAVLWPWQLATALLALALLGSLSWGLSFRAPRRTPDPGHAATRSDGRQQEADARLRAALAQGDLAHIAATLSALRPPGSAWRECDQQSAWEALQRLRWSPDRGSTDPAHLLAQLRGAFARGARWDARQPAQRHARDVDLPPLYPPG